MGENNIRDRIDIDAYENYYKVKGSYNIPVCTTDYDQLGIYSKVLGIIALILAFIWTLPSLVCAIISIVQGVKNHKYGSYYYGDATIGIRCSIVAIVIPVLVVGIAVLNYIVKSLG